MVTVVVVVDSWLSVNDKITTNDRSVSGVFFFVIFFSYGPLLYVPVGLYFLFHCVLS